MKENITGAQAILESLVAEGVDTIFGYPGGAIMPTYDALYDYREQLRHILVRHEQCAAHAAEGYARIQNKPGVCLVTSGPGATNLVTGIADAMLDSVPIVCITGQVAKAVLGTDAFQETDVIGVTMPITKWNYQISSPEEIPHIMAKAFYVARTGRPGPVVVDITKNAQIDTLNFEYKPFQSLKSFTPAVEPKEEAVREAAEVINAAKRPLMLIGHGILISQAQQEVREFVEKSGVPVASTLLGLSAYPTGHELYAGMLGMHGNYGPNKLTNEADVIFAVGMRFDDRVTGNLDGYVKNAKVIHIDVDPAEINKNVVADVAIVADAKRALQALLPLINKNSHAEWLARFKECDRIEDEKVIQRDMQGKGGKPVMADVVRRLSEKTRGEAIVVADVGQHQMMAARYYGFQQPDSWITSGGLGTMGFALPAAFGAKVAAPEREVVAIIGDGSFQMTLQELATLAQEKCAVKIIILNNNFLGMVRQWQELFFESRYSFVNLENPDFVKVSEGFRIPAERVESRDDLDAALDRLIAEDGPRLLEIVVEKEENVFPMVPSGESVSNIRLE